MSSTGALPVVITQFLCISKETEHPYYRRVGNASYDEVSSADSYSRIGETYSFFRGHKPYVGDLSSVTLRPGAPCDAGTSDSVNHMPTTPYAFAPLEIASVRPFGAWVKTDDAHAGVSVLGLPLTASVRAVEA